METRFPAFYMRFLTNLASESLIFAITCNMTRTHAHTIIPIMTQKRTTACLRPLSECLTGFELFTSAILNIRVRRLLTAARHYGWRRGRKDIVRKTQFQSLSPLFQALQLINFKMCLAIKCSRVSRLSPPRDQKNF